MKSGVQLYRERAGKGRGKEKTVKRELFADNETEEKRTNWRGRRNIAKDEVKNR